MGPGPSVQSWDRETAELPYPFSLCFFPNLSTQVPTKESHGFVTICTHTLYDLDKLHQFFS